MPRPAAQELKRNTRSSWPSPCPPAYPNEPVLFQWPHSKGDRSPKASLDVSSHILRSLLLKCQYESLQRLASRPNALAMKTCVLGAVTVALATGVARAAPQSTRWRLCPSEEFWLICCIGVGIGFVPVPTVFPITNATDAPKPTPTDTGSACEASCAVRYPELFGISWAREDQIVYTETVTVATISIITSTINNKTIVGTHTVYDGDPFVSLSHTLYHVSADERGTKVVEAGITLADGYTFTTFAYPTPFIDYPAQYHWEGIMPTLGKYKEPVCITRTDQLEVAEVTPHPLYPQPTDVVPDKQDSQGAGYVPLWVPLQQVPDKKWFDNAFPSESAFVYCEPTAGKLPPDVISTAKFVTVTAITETSMKQPGFVHTESQATGWEETPTKGPPGLQQPTERPKTQHAQSSTRQNPEQSRQSPQQSTQQSPQLIPQPSSQQSPQRSRSTSRPGSSSVGVPDIPIIIPTLPPGDVRPSARPSSPSPQNPGAKPQPQPTSRNIGGHSIPAANNPDDQPPTTPAPAVTPAPGVNPAPALPPAPTPAPNAPIFTFIPTTINGRPTATPIFIIPGPSSSTATIGQTLDLGNGQSTVFTAPTAVFAIVPTTINNIPTSVSAFIISGTSTATIGQTVTLDGRPTVLTPPPILPSSMPTTILGIATHVPVYIVSGSITAFPGQTITFDGQVTVLPTADALFTSVTSTVDGKATVIPAYIISGSVTATLGQTVTVGGSTTVLSMPSDEVVYTSVTTTVDGKETVVPVYVISGSVTATLGSTVTVGGSVTVLGAPTETGGSGASEVVGGEIGPKETGGVKGGGVRGWRTSFSALAVVGGMWVMALMVG